MTDSALKMVFRADAGRQSVGQQQDQQDGLLTKITARCLVNSGLPIAMFPVLLSLDMGCP